LGGEVEDRLFGSCTAHGDTVHVQAEPISQAEYAGAYADNIAGFSVDQSFLQASLGIIAR
jgi:hypothetical protein